MRHFSWMIVAVSLIAAPLTANAGFVVEASIGKGLTLNPEVTGTDLNIMIAPGYGIGEMLRLELGVVTALGDVSSDFDLEFRPMLVIDPPLFPLYGRLVVGVVNVANEADVAFAFGGALGMSVSLGGAGIFGEAGVLPRSVADQFLWVLEFRAGVYYAF